MSSLNKSKRVSLTEFDRIVTEMESTKMKIECLMQDKMREYQRMLQANQAEVKKELAECKEYVSTLHSEFDRIDRIRKKDRVEIQSACLN